MQIHKVISAVHIRHLPLGRGRLLDLYIIICSLICGPKWIVNALGELTVKTDETNRGKVIFSGYLAPEEKPVPMCWGLFHNMLYDRKKAFISWLLKHSSHSSQKIKYRCVEVSFTICFTICDNLWRCFCNWVSLLCSERPGLRTRPSRRWRGRTAPTGSRPSTTSAGYAQISPIR